MRSSRGRGAAHWLVLLSLAIAAQAQAAPAVAGRSDARRVATGASPLHEVDPSPPRVEKRAGARQASQNGYWVMASPSLRVRSCPSTSCGQIGSLSYQTYIDIACQGEGENVGGSTIWDQLSSHYPGGWVSDYWVYTGYNGYDPRLPRCGATSREDRAVTWARSQLGATGWNGWCDRFVANASGRDHSGYATATAHYNDLRNRGLVHQGDTNIPYGALAFSGGNSSAGHVMLSLGNGRFITTAEQVKEVGLSYGRQYWGWAWANPEWPGR